jgi:hypothetical protein
MGSDLGGCTYVEDVRRRESAGTSISQAQRTYIYICIGGHVTNRWPRIVRFKSRYEEVKGRERGTNGLGNRCRPRREEEIIS